MLWFKGWLEIRVKMLLSLCFMAVFLIFAHTVGAKTPPPGAKSAVFGFVVFSIPSFVVVICTWLAGAGIATQPSVQATKGLHGSTLFTLSLPVSRFRLLAVRAGLGWLGIAGLIGVECCGMWLLLPGLKGAATAIEMFEFAGALLACASAIYFVGVLLATFLDDLWRVWGTMIVPAALWWVPGHTPLPASVDIFRAMGEGSPLLAHTVPWAVMAFSLGLAAILFFAALKVVQLREY
jgi:hypothetical protein